MKALAWVAIALSGCAGSAQWSGVGSRGGTSSGSSGESRVVTMPNVTLMTSDQAQRVLRQAGFAREVIFDTSLCGSTVDHTIVVELGQVCYQMPAAGNQTSTGSPVSLRVQREDPWRGELRNGGFWFLMPNFAGADLDVARAKIRQLGFTSKEVLISYVEEPGCRPHTVCRTYPEGLVRTDNTSDKIFFVGGPPPAEAAIAPGAPSPAQPDNPSAPPPTSKPADIF